jgi:uncharacterized protein YggE
MKIQSMRLQNLINSFITTFIAVILTICTVVPSTRAVAQGSTPNPRTISVSGEAQVNVVPDQVIITLGVETVDRVLATSKAKNDERMTAILDVIKRFEIPQEKVQTDYIGIEPRYTSTYAQSDFIGYFVRKNVVITLTDLTKFEGLLSALLESGANYVMGVNFRTSDLRKYRDQARELAITAAKEKAEALAGALGQKIGKPLTISEEPVGYWSYYSSWWGGYGSGGGMSQNVMQNAAPSGGNGAPDASTTIAPGQIAVTARVNVIFELTD